MELGKFYNLWRFFASPAAMLLLVTVLALVDLKRRDLLRAAGTLGTGMAAFMLLLVIVAMPRLEEAKLTPLIGPIIARESRPEDVVLHRGYISPTLVFYSRRELTKIPEKLTDAAELEILHRHVASGRRVFYVLPADRAEALLQRAGEGLRIRELFPGDTGHPGRGYDTGHGKWEHWKLIRVEKGEGPPDSR
jgi:hypothetical protein